MAILSVSLSRGSYRAWTGLYMADLPCPVRLACRLLLLVSCLVYCSALTTQAIQFLRYVVLSPTTLHGNLEDRTHLLMNAR